MARTSSPAIPSDIVERIEDVDVSNEMQSSFLEYAYSVIYSRALPDARDGLKPVQRRILYQMAEMGLRPDRGHVKSARVVGEVMGKLHPHGDSAIYDALVRMAQDFTLRVPLVDGHGNFGSLDDGPAASRYTEARLALSSLALTESLDEDVVDFVPNYDNQLTQPSVLPAAFPNLLVNGASGIAVGMATNMAPHNLSEVVSAARYLIAHPEATLDELMEHVPAPDFPSGGTIVGLDGVRDAYETGRGAVRVRARVSIEQVTARKQGLVITELPYLVGPEKIIEKIKDGVNAKKITGISDVVDLTDRKNGLKLVVEIKSGFDPQAVLEQLYRQTPLEDSFSMNNVALVAGGPQTLGLRELLQVYIDHRIEVVTRRSRYRLTKRRERLHLVEGLLIAILDIDEVIQVIRTSDDAETARGRLIDVFDLSQLQADYILELRLRRLTKFSRMELEGEADKLRAEIEALEKLLASSSAIRAEVSAELEQVSEQFATPRRTLLNASAPAPAPRSSKATPSLQLSDAPCIVVLSASGRIARIDAAEGETEVTLTIPTKRMKHDAIRSQLRSTRRTEIAAITSSGRLIRFSPMELPALAANAPQLAVGVKVSDYLGLTDRSEQVLTLIALDHETPLALGTAQGVVKRVAPGGYPAKPSFELIALKDGDRVIGAGLAADDDAVMFVSAGAQLLHYPSKAVRPQGLAAGGMAGISLAAGDRALFFGVITNPAETVVVTIATSAETLSGVEPGSGKVSALEEFPAKGRATGGVRAQRFLKGETELALAWAGRQPAYAVAADGSARTLPEGLAKRDASGSALEATVDAVGEALSNA